jgi:sugar/nucleoside kinase (ribokinase family)
MTSSPLDVLAIGNALVDVIAHVDNEFLDRHGLAKGSMALIDAARAETFYDLMPPAIEMSGGSAGNTIVGVASLGGRAAYIGRVRDDQLGQVFQHDMRAAGVAFDVPLASTGPSTGRCLIAVTPDAQRTMQTYLGASSELTPADIQPDLVASAGVTYLEGYLWDPPLAKEAFVKAARVAHETGRKVALTLSDSFCVDRHRADFVDLVDHHIDILFANQAELESLYEVSDFGAAAAAVRGRCEIAAITRSALGSVVVAGDASIVVPAAPVETVVDTTGAGDLYAAGFLYALARGMSLADCGRIGGIAAGEVISHFGARPEVSLADLVRGQR